MSVSIYKIKKWSKMLLGTSALHVNQNEGKLYSKDEVKGYYNNLTEKITRFGNNEIVPKSVIDTGESMYFSIGIFQYGLAAYDLYLSNNDEKMLKIVKGCANWAIENQDREGGWVTFENEVNPYSAMAQGEAISLLIRCYLQFGKEEYKEAARRAMHFMLTPVENRGTAIYKGKDLYLYEYPSQPCVLNGWIFAAWGLYDYAKAFNDIEAEEKWTASVSTIAKSLKEFDNGYWSKYNMGKMIASPFYHNLHIAQLNVLFDLTGKDIFRTYSNRFTEYQEKRVFRYKAFLFKSWQKIME